jgi:hypothetical protein
MTNHTFVMMFALAGSLAVSGCKGKAKDDGGAANAKPTTAAAGTKETALVPGGVKPPDGITFKKLKRPFGTIEMPDGGGWTLGEHEVTGPDGTVIMMQGQDGITPAQRDEYLASYNDVQNSSAPKYQRIKQELGVIGSAAAARVEGTFDNGTKFVTRDYLVFDKGGVINIAARTPEPNAAKLGPIVDYAISTIHID